MFSLPEQCKLVSVMRPIDKTGAAFTTEWISMKNAEKATFIIDLGVMTSTSNQAVKLKVANDASGTKSASSKSSMDLTLPHYYKTSSGDTLAKTTVSSSTFNLTKSSDAKYFIIEVEASKMGTFTSGSSTYDADYVAISVATPGTHACLAGVSCLLTGLRYQEDAPPTAIT